MTFFTYVTGQPVLCGYYGLYGVVRLCSDVIGGHSNKNSAVRTYMLVKPESAYYPNQFIPSGE